jgi:CRISPR-associated protein Csb1
MKKKTRPTRSRVVYGQNSTRSPAHWQRERNPMEELTLQVLQEAVAGTSAAFRSRRRLQPAGGEGDKVFPPTFAGADYAIERRRMAAGSDPVTCVLLDSVQSQANRMEAALQGAVDDKQIEMPLVVVDFSASDPTGDLEADKAAGRFIDPVGRISSLQVPHRLSDAIIRDSQLDGVDFRRSDRGKGLNRMSGSNATPLFELCPQALVFGMWDSTGPKGGLGAKYERVIVSEVVGIGAEIGDLRRGVRRDPLEIRAAVKVWKNPDKTWSVADPGMKGKEVVAPSKVNHSSVPFPEERDKKSEKNIYDGVTIAYAQQTTTLSLIGLRRLGFPLKGDLRVEANRAARTVLAALGLCAATLASESGMDLRSRCLLWPDEPMSWELLDRPGKSLPSYSLSGSEALNLVRDAVAVARAFGFDWSAEPIVLTPKPDLVRLVRESQLQATTEDPGQGN